MSSDILILLILIIIVLFGSAWCSGVEAALLTVNPLRVYELSISPKSGTTAKLLAKLRKRLGRTLSVLVIANNGFNIFGSLMLGGYSANVFDKRGIGGIALPIFSIGLTILVIILGEILPKSLSSRFALQVSLASAPILQLLSLIMNPLVLLLERIMPTITAENEFSTNEEEIRQLARIGSQKGKIEADEAAMISKVFQLNDITARDLMTPRVAVPTLDGSTNLNSFKELLLKNNSRWWVVLGNKVDKVLGIANRESLLQALMERQDALKAEDLCEPVEFVPEMIRADRLLDGFQKDKNAIRVVVDEFGGFVGLIGADAVLSVLAGWWRKPS